MIGRSTIVYKGKAMKDAIENTLVIIDPEYSFCDPKGELFVPGADEDMKRTAEFLARNVASINEVIVTKDNHPRYHIGFPSFWHNRAGLEPMPFSVLSLMDDDTICDQDGNEFFPIQSLGGEYTSSIIKRYLKTVKKHIIWPFHCVEHTIGSTIVESINESLYLWEKIHNKKPVILNKGENQLVEEYSIVQPEDKVHDPNWFFLGLIKKSKTVYWAGEALSHCVKKSLMDCYNFNYKNAPKHSPSIDCNWFLLKDRSSPVSGFNKEVQELIDFCVSNEINFTESKLTL